MPRNCAHPRRLAAAVLLASLTFAVLPAAASPRAEENRHPTVHALLESLYAWTTALFSAAAAPFVAPPDDTEATTTHDGENGLNLDPDGRP